MGMALLMSHIIELARIARLYHLRQLHGRRADRLTSAYTEQVYPNGICLIP